MIMPGTCVGIGAMGSRAPVGFTIRASDLERVQGGQDSSRETGNDPVYNPFGFL